MISGLRAVRAPAMMGDRFTSVGRDVVRRTRRAVSAETLARARRLPLQPQVVLYESFAGNGMLCNPEAIFRYLLEAPDFGHLCHVWALTEKTAIARLTKEFAADHRVRFVRRGSSAYWRELSTAGYLINNSTFPSAFSKRPGQLYLNTWHGTPLKRMGFDMPGGVAESANVVRNFLDADFLLAANAFMAEAMYEEAYRLRNMYNGRLIEEGYPRIDSQFCDRSASVAIAELSAAGVRTEGKRRVLFAPTWRGARFGKPVNEVSSLARQVAQLQAALGDDTAVLLKTHQTVYTFARSRPELRDILVPNTIPTNQLLAATSALVTDYSSIFFDFLATGRPIGFVLAADYLEERGTYFTADQLPGPCAPTAGAIGADLRRLIDSGVPHPRYGAWVQRFVPHEDGGASARIVDIVFRGNGDRYRVRPARSDGRKRLLLSLGGMRANGITSSALSLLSSIDHSRYDVTAVMPWSRSASVQRFRDQIHPDVRQILRVGGMNGSKVHHALRRMHWGTAPVLPGHRAWSDRLWGDEWRRVFGGAKFDWAADFSGYSPFWANLILYSASDLRAIWLHNDLAADRMKVIDGRRPKKRSLRTVFALYRGFDQLVSVSPSLSRINRHKLCDYADVDRFRSLRNLPDLARVQSGRHWPFASVDGAETPAWRRALEDAESNLTWFVNVGRLSPEKNQERLIRAFAGVHAKHAGVRLLIVGDGPLRARLGELIRDAQLADAVHLAGHQANPFNIMSRADCFVLSSTYEGQPMVLLEAALCGLPIVSTAFDSVDDGLPTRSIHVVAQTDAALEEGMLAFLEGRVIASSLNAGEYTAEVLREFDRMVGGDGGTHAAAIREHAIHGPASAGDGSSDAE